ncbi:probable E3 SUMO-protein ligase RNF212 isoform X2 [Dendrobates tinctorius]|uniref:probable E3 SUMO-protein ligase RNF212 isoform X2 n=1 Tax=Dendrobates tinctorius TaxID=92724 RepID=UPI003CC9F917
MNDLVRCNLCFQQPGRKASRFSITSCGHVFCEQCLRKGINEKCGVCKATCRTILLSNETDPDIKMLFTDVSVLCKKFLTEFTQVVEFQDSHRQRLLAHYKKKIVKLEETIKELTQQLQSCSLRASQSYSRPPTSNSYRSLDPTNSEDRRSPSVSHVPSLNMDELMDQTSNASRKRNSTIGGLTRLSLVTPSPPGFKVNSEDRFSPSASQVLSINKVELMDQTSNSSRRKNLTIGGSSRLSLITPSPPGFMDQMLDLHSTIFSTRFHSLCHQQAMKVSGTCLVRDPHRYHLSHLYLHRHPVSGSPLLSPTFCSVVIKK